MAIAARLQHVRGSTAAHTSFTGLEGEITMDTTKSTVVIHDGATAGGHPMAKESRKIKADGTNIKVNNSSEATLANDITISFDGAELTKTIVNTITTGNPAGGAAPSTPTDQQKALATSLISKDAKNIIVKGTDDMLYAGFTATYAVATGVLTFKDSKNNDLSTVTIPAGSSMFEQATVVTNPSGQPAGTYIDFKYTTQAGAEQHVYANVTTLVDVVSAGNGITAVDNNVSVKLATANPGLEFDGSGGLKLTADAGKTYTAGNGIDIDSNGVVSVVLHADNNLLQFKEGKVLAPSDLGTI